MSLLLLAVLHQAQPPIVAETRPNILFAISDDQSYPHTSAYGCRWVNTPAFDRVAREGLLFDNCYTPNAKCAPSRSIVLTGRHSWQLGAAANHVPIFPPEQPVYTEMLERSGYRVGMTGKGWAPGVALTADGQPRHLAGTPYNKRKAKPPTGKMSRTDYAANFRDFLDDAAKPADGGAGSGGAKPQPWCFWYGGHEPHRAYEYGSGARLGGKSITAIDDGDVPGYWPDSDTVRNDLLDYALEIEHFDRHLGEMLAELDRRNLFETTLVVVTSDNGMPFPRVKGQTYERSHHLPLAISWPAGISDPGRRVRDFVSFVDLAPTFVDLAGLDTFGLAPAGRTLWPIFDTETIELENGFAEPDRDLVFLGKERHDLGRPGDAGYPSRGLVMRDWLYLRNHAPDRWPAGNPETGYMNTDGSPTKTQILQMRRDGSDRNYWRACFGRRPALELYNLAADPDCLLNLADLPSTRRKQAEMAERLDELLDEENDPRHIGLWPEGIADFDDYPYADESMRGYYEQAQAGQAPKAGWIEPTDIETEPVE